MSIARHHIPRIAAALGALGLVVPTISQAAPAKLATGSSVQYPAGPGSPTGSLVVGPDGNLWYPYLKASAAGTSAGISSLSPSTGKVVHSFPLPADSFNPSYWSPDLIVGPDGNLWFLQTTKGGGGLLVQITLAGAVTTFALALPAGSYPTDLVSGPDGNLWMGFLEGVDVAMVARITPEGVITMVPTPDGAVQARQLLVGTDGNLWFTASTDPMGNVIGTMSTAGSGSVFPMPGGSPFINANGTLGNGPDGNVWAVAERTDVNGALVATPKVMSISPLGVATTVATVSAFNCAQVPTPCTVITGADGSAWIGGGGGLGGGGGVIRVGTNGLVSTFVAPAAGGIATAGDLVSGPDGNIWFASGGSGTIGRMATGSGTAIPVPSKTVLGCCSTGSAVPGSVTRGKKVPVTFLPGASASGKTLITLTHGSTVSKIWSGSVAPGTVKSVSATVPKSFPKGKATMLVQPPKAAGKASVQVTVRG